MLRSTLFALCLLTTFTASAHARGLTAEQTVEVAVTWVDENGLAQTRYEPAGEVAPGDQVRYRLTFLNDGEEAAVNVQLDMPVPDQVTLVDGSVEAGGAAVSYSVDNGQTYGVRAVLRIEDEAGERAASSEDITNIRWTFAQAIGAGESGEISYLGVLQ